MVDYEISKNQFKKKNVRLEIGKKIWFASLSDPGIMKVRIKKIKRDIVTVTPCDPFKK